MGALCFGLEELGEREGLDLDVPGWGSWKAGMQYPGWRSWRRGWKLQAWGITGQSLSARSANMARVRGHSASHLWGGGE